MLAWIDLEMTGLDPEVNVIVEIATLITDDDLQIVAEGPNLIVHASDAELEKMDPFVLDMHTRCGLLPVSKAATIDSKEGGDQPLAFL